MMKNKSMNLKDQFVKERNMGIIPMEMTFKDYVDMQTDLSQTYAVGGRVNYAIGGNEGMMMRDSGQGLGSMMASATDKENDPYRDMKVPTDMIDDPEGTMQTNDEELIRQIMQSGQLTELKNGLSPEQLSDIGAMYDSAVEDGRFQGGFDEFLAVIVLQQAKKSSGRGEGIMSTMRG